MNIESLRYLLKSIAGKFGIGIHRLSPTTDPTFQIVKCLQKFDINIVLDIGANSGQFCRGLRSMGYDKTVVSFEPLIDAHAKLKKNALNDKNWKIHPRGAIGNFNGEISINVSKNSVSSSFLPMLEAHLSAAVESAYIKSELTPIRMLDEVASSYILKNSNLFIKVDTQGFEWQVLDGGAATFKRAHGILLELSLVKLYEGQRLWLEIISRLEEMGFALWGLQNGFTDPESGRTLQVDAIFTRNF